MNGFLYSGRPLALTPVQLARFKSRGAALGAYSDPLSSQDYIYRSKVTAKVPQFSSRQTL